MAGKESVNAGYEKDSGEKGVVDKEMVDSGKGKKKAGEEQEVFRVGFSQLFHGADSVDWMLMTLGTTGAFLNGMAMPIFFLVYRQFLDAFQMGSTNIPELARKNSMWLLYLGVLAFGGSWAAVASFNYSAERQAGTLRQQYFAAILKQDVAFFDNNVRTGQLVMSITNDIAKIQEAVGDKLALFTASLATFFAGFIIGFIERWQVALLTLAVIPLLTVSQVLLMTLTSKMAQKGDKWYEEAGEIAEQSIAQVRTVYSYVGEKRTLDAYSTALERALKPSYVSGSFKGLALGLAWLSLLASWALIFWYGGILVSRSQATGGEVTSAMFAIVFSGVAVGRSITSLSAFNEGRAAAYKILSVIQNEPTISVKNSGKETLPSVKGELSFRDVCFSYPSRPEVTILRDLSLVIQAGTKFAIIGSSGSGKSTIISLIERFYNPTSGSILLDGHNIIDLELQWLRGKIGLVGQEPVLFDATIKENILYFKEGATDEEIEEVAKLANAHSFISELPQGFQTEVGERGVQLSGGQKQRVAIARALLRRPAILLLDEATSALDSGAEQAVQEAVDKAKVGRTTVVIAHRLSTIQTADCIAVIQNGQVVELGSHSELISKEGGHYSELLRLQGSARRLQPQTSYRRDSLWESRPGNSSRRLAQRLSFESPSPSRVFVVGDGSPQMGTHKPGGDFGVGRSSSLSNAQKPGNEKTPARPIVLESLFRLCRPEWGQAFLGAFFSVISGIATPLIAFYLGDIIAAFNEPNHEDMRRRIGTIACIYIAIGIVFPIVSWLQFFFLEFMAANLLKRVREMMLAAMLRNEVGWFDRDENSSHRLTARVAIGAANVKAATSDRIAILLQNSSILVTAFILSFSQQWKLSLVLVGTFPFFVVSAILDAMFFRGFAGDVAKSHERAARIAGEAVSSIRTVVAFGAENKLLQLLKFELEGPKANALGRGISFGLAYGASQFCHFASFSVGLWYAVHLAYTGEANVHGVLKAFFTILISSYSISDTLTMAPDFIRGRQAVRSLSEVLDRETEIDPDSKDGTALEKAVGRVELRKVTFSYPSRPEIPVLRNLSLKIRAGTSLALVGPSGCGKSSIIALIERFYDPQNGEVLIDGVSIRKYNLRSLRQHIALVQQEPSLFATTIYENIVYGKEGATEAEVVEAAKAANAHNFISALPNGYQTHVGERGVQLSGGQKQRVAIARAVLKNPTILLLDEATSALDAESEKVVQDALDRLMQSRSTLLVAHRLSTVTSADQIAVLEDGSVQEQGTHQELVSEPYSAFNRLTQRAIAISHPQ